MGKYSFECSVVYFLEIKRTEESPTLGNFITTFIINDKFQLHDKILIKLKFNFKKKCKQNDIIRLYGNYWLNKWLCVHNNKIWIYLVFLHCTFVDMKIESDGSSDSLTLKQRAMWFLWWFLRKTCNYSHVWTFDGKASIHSLWNANHNYITSLPVFTPC